MTAPSVACTVRQPRLAAPGGPGEPALRGRRPARDDRGVSTYDDQLERVRTICLSLPEVTERLSHGAPTWFVRGKSTFVTFWVHGHHEHQFPHLWCAAPPGVQQELVESEPDHFFRPPYVGGRGWIGVRMDRAADWNEMRHICTDAYRAVAPARLVKELDGR